MRRWVMWVVGVLVVGLVGKLVALPPGARDEEGESEEEVPVRVAGFGEVEGCEYVGAYSATMGRSVSNPTSGEPAAESGVLDSLYERAREADVSHMVVQTGYGAADGGYGAQTRSFGLGLMYRCPEGETSGGEGADSEGGEREKEETLMGVKTVASRCGVEKKEVLEDVSAGKLVFREIEGEVKIPERYVVAYCGWK